VESGLHLIQLPNLQLPTKDEEISQTALQRIDTWLKTKLESVE